MPDIHDIAALLGLSEALVGHPHLSHLREQINRELAAANVQAGEHLKQIKEEEKANADQAEQDKANAEARKHQEGKPTPVRNTYEGVPGTAEMGEADWRGLNKPQAIPSSKLDVLAQSDLPNIDRRT